MSQVESSLKEARICCFNISLVLTVSAKSSAMDFFFACGTTLFVIYLINHYLLSYWSRRGFFQLKPTFLVGDIGSVVQQKASIGEMLQNVYNNYKSKRVVGLYFSYKPVMVINDPLLVQDVLVRDYTSFHDRGFYTNEKNDPLSAHLVSAGGQEWRDMRVKLSPTFSSGKIKGMFPIISDCGKVLEDYFIKNIKEGKNKFDCKELFTRYTTSIISSVAFGVDTDCINNPDNIFRQMSCKMLDSSIGKDFRQFMILMMPNLPKYLPIKTVTKEIEDFFLSVVNQTIEHREKTNFSRNDFIQLLIQMGNQGYVSVNKKSNEQEKLNDEDLKKLTIPQIAAQAFIFFGAG